MYLVADQPQPAYRADFYTPENIIGYTGELRRSPTVYFRSDTEFGHITQQHDSQWNIGREGVGDLVYPGWTYVIRNELKDGREVAVERYLENNGDGSIHIHTSRNKFIDTRRANIDVFALLAQAIWKFTAQKTGELRGRRRWA